MSVHKGPPLDSRSRAKRFQRASRAKKTYIYRYVKNESSAVCFSRWAQGNRKNHTVGGRYESTEGRQQKGDPALREKKRSLQEGNNGPREQARQKSLPGFGAGGL